MKKPSFLARLTGSDDTDYFDDSSATRAVFEGDGEERHAHIGPRDGSPGGEWVGEEPAGELAVDVYQTPDAIVVKALVAGGQPASKNISLTREVLTLSGPRPPEREGGGGQGGRKVGKKWSSAALSIRKLKVLCKRIARITPAAAKRSLAPLGL